METRPASATDLTCPTCGKAVIVIRYLNEGSVDDYTSEIDPLGHESCNQTKLLVAVRRSLKKPKAPKVATPRPKTDRTIINRRNRKNGSTAQTEWARIIHGRNVGILGREDVDDGIRLWEVKARKMPAWIREAFTQVNKHQGDRLRYVVVRNPGRQGQAVEWWVIEKAEQFIDVAGLGNYPPEEPKRRMRR